MAKLGKYVEKSGKYQYSTINTTLIGKICCSVTPFLRTSEISSKKVHNYLVNSRAYSNVMPYANFQI